jgi:DNA (cytosine-5)-methyltransferase 1
VAAMRPRLLDLFCGAGGAAMGYYRAGFDIVGVDLKPQPRYPFAFVQADALRPPFRLESFDTVHASPPCQDYSRSTKHLATSTRGRLIWVVADMLTASGRPWIIENVEGAPIPRSSNMFGEHGAMVCGTGVGLPRVRRHRLFLASFPIQSTTCRHMAPPMNPYNAASRIRDGLRYGSGRAYLLEMGIGWMNDFKREGSLAIPPAYTEFIGRQLLQVVVS